MGFVYNPPNLNSSLHFCCLETVKMERLSIKKEKRGSGGGWDNSTGLAITNGGLKLKRSLV